MLRKNLSAPQQGSNLRHSDYKKIYSIQSFTRVNEHSHVTRFKACSDHSLNLFLVVPGSTSWPHFK